nr:hypothetical protein [Paenibacillus sp. BJ-4]
MNKKLTNYLNGVFAPYDGVKSVTELKTDLLSDLQERFHELKAEGKNDETAFEMPSLTAWSSNIPICEGCVLTGKPLSASSLTRRH